ncbi:hypothetical protein U5640_25545 [Streptomyces sp. SS7]|uniref:hypothetical protein n=1 Tax=Streptomyces sp. SS7 TaxID=3108485 RepID=UPI0030EBAE3E
MTQSGQGEEPSARPAREGIVLPSDGGEPLIPGLTDAGGPQSGPPRGGRPGPYGAQSYGQQPPAQQPPAQPPAGGQTWGQPWGPEQQAPTGQQEQGWPLPPDQQPQQWGTAQPDPWGAGPLPPEGGAPGQTYGQSAPAAPQPSYDGNPQGYPGYGQHRQTPSPYDQAPQVSAAPPTYPPGGPGAPVPPYADGADGATQYIPPVPSGPVDDARTQVLPPVPAAGPVPGGDEAATQYIPPVRPGALPPESPGGAAHYPGAAHSDAEATQYLPPVPAQGGPTAGGGAQPPAGFENLFRDGPAGAGAGAPAGATQQLPRITEPEIPGYGGGPQGYGARPVARAPQPTYVPPVRRDDHGDERGRGGRTGSRLPLFAAVGVAIAVVGIGAGALLGGGGGDDDKGDGSKPVAASASAGEPSASADDAAEQQATALDKLLADSGSSRASVIAAVADVKACDNLDQAASDLRAAAGQRNELVTKLAALDVDQLPDHAALTGALTKAWQASAAADNHYADWADEVAGNKRKACRKGGARTTNATQQGNRESGTASAQKNQAARLWNGIARKYGLTERQPTQL